MQGFNRFVETFMVPSSLGDVFRVRSVKTRSGMSPRKMPGSVFLPYSGGRNIHRSQVYPRYFQVHPGGTGFCREEAVAVSIK